MSALVKTRKNARLVAGVLAFCSAIVACSAATSSPGAALVVDCVPTDALISVDGDPIITLDRARDGFVPVPVGQHRLEITAPGYLPYRTVFDFVAGAVYDVRVELWPEIEELDE